MADTPYAPLVTKAPVAAATTAAAPPAPSRPAPAFPPATVARIGAGWWAHRWWMRQQNPALFREDD